MLIPSHRHTAADLRLWAEMEEADHCFANQNGCERIRQNQADAMNSLIEFLMGQSAVGPAYCGVSWGKDSVCVAHLLRCVDPLVPLVHLRPSNHNPDCDAVRDSYFAAFPGQLYIEVKIDYGDLHRRELPHYLLDKETDERWYAAIRDCERRFGHRHILGIRGEESGGRKVRMFRWGNNSPNACAPIGWWTERDVFAYLAWQNLPVHPVYAMLGNGRWPREKLRTAEIGDTHGRGGGRNEFEKEYYGDVLNRLIAGC